MGTIVFELNEVPWQVMDWFCERNPRSSFAKIRRAGRHYEAVAEDRGHLHPWVTWPSLHRGVNDEEHGIGHLGQDLNEVNRAYPPVWELLRQQGRRIGVGGSLHSYPPPQETRDVSFYVPDTFASGPETIPPGLSSFQDVSLQLTRENGRNVSSRTGGSAVRKLIGALPKMGVTPRSMIEIGSQLVREQTDKTKVNRRRAMQSVLYFDVFMSQLRATKPDFSTYFTNHVAAAMHRYWAATFQDDYDDFRLPDDWIGSYGGEIEWAMRLADGFAARLMRFCEANPGYGLVICSSMGQAATTAELCEGSYQLRDIDKFCAALDIDRADCKQALAMAPDVSLHMLTDQAAQRLRAAMPAIIDALGGEWDIDEANMVHISIRVDASPESSVPDITIGNRSYPIAELGFDFLPDQDKVRLTAYHVPEGVLMSWSPGEDLAGAWERSSVSALEIAPAMLKSHGVNPPEYMRPTALNFG